MSPGKRVQPRPSTASALVTFNFGPPIRLILPSSSSTLRCSSTCSPSKIRTSRMSCRLGDVWQNAAVAHEYTHNMKTVDLKRIRVPPVGLDESPNLRLAAILLWFKLALRG